jgi:3-oxoacyl-[acyl-carrier protein] reductase
MTGELAGKVAIVTGAGHGFGRQICLTLGGKGATIAACDINEKKLAETKKEVSDAGIAHLIETLDVTDEAGVKRFVNKAMSSLGGVDILVNNAGGTLGYPWRPVDELPTAEWDRIVKVNMYAPMFFIREVAGHMKEKKAGKIVNIASGAGRAYSRTGVQAYSAAKAGVMGLTRQVAQELGRYNVNVNAVAPGLIMSTEEGQRDWAAKPELDREITLDTVALKRLGTVHDIANMVLFLVTEAGNWIQGQTILVDGGHWMF